MMKKVAICISGLPRNVEEGFNNIYKNIILPNNNPDIFIHSWVGDDEVMKSKILNLYKPKLFVFEEQKIFINDMMELDRMMVSHGRSYTRDKFVDMIYSSWFSILSSNNLKEQYRLSNNIVYDYVIRARFDVTYNTQISCFNYPNDKIYVCNRQLPDHDMTDDRFAFGSNHNMNIYSSGFNFLDYICKLRDTKDGIFCGETLVYEILKMSNIHSFKIEELTLNRLHSDR